MTTLIQLPGNETALFRDSEELSNRDVKQIRRAARIVGITAQRLKGLGLDEIQAEIQSVETPSDDTNQKALEILTQLTDDEDDNLDLFQRECAAVRLVEWSLDLPLPKTASDIDLLPRPLYAALIADAAKIDLAEDFSMDGASDPKVVTAESVALEQPSADSL